MRSISIMITVAMALAITTPLAAQSDSGRPPGCPPDGHMPRHGKMAANFENLRLLKLLETVDLSDEQSEQFIPIFHAFRRDMKELLERRRELIGRLAEQVTADASDEKLHQSIEQLIDVKAKIGSLRDAFVDDCRAILSTTQLARLVIFQERFERDILESLREFRRHGPRGMDNKR